jgi:hypothetical protein
MLDMPAKKGAGCDDACQVPQNSAARLLSFCGQPPSLVVSEPKSFSTDLILEDSILLSQVLDRSLLVLVDPASESRDEELRWLEDSRHSGIPGAIPLSARLLTEATGG